jgi:prephenate dehydrogenase
MKRPSVAIVGLGLIGGSLLRALTRSGYDVLGVDRPAVLRQVRAARAAAALASDLAAVRRADVVVLAAPPAANLKLLRAVARLDRREGVITDVGSVKLPICREAARLAIANFVGGHPMAGSERHGFAASRADLFARRPWILTPASGARRGLRAVRSLALAVGARPYALGAAEHDRVVAFLSHVPQLAAWALLEAARGDPVARRNLELAGPGFHDMTRLASSPRPLWREILKANRKELGRAVRAFRRALAGSGLS